jgi:branched-chain amino acid aminotransferase
MVFAIPDAVTPPQIDLQPDRIEFGRTFTPLWFRTSFAGGVWEDGRIETLSDVHLHPGSVVLHYGQAVFEGMKAYRAEGGSVNLFRPLENAKRFNRSAQRMAMPEFPERLFLEAVCNLVDRQREWVPEAPGSLYIRPVMICTEPCLGVHGGDEFLFYIVTLPAGIYFRQGLSSGGTVAVRVFVSEHVGRAAHGGTGNVKAPGNYGITLSVIAEARGRGCPQVLFLDSCGNRTVEEMGGMNVFFVRDGILITPPVDDTILPGITRDSIIKMAPSLGFRVEEKEVKLEDLITAIHSGSVSEAFACGTAASVVGISSLVFENGDEVRLGGGECGPATEKIFRTLQAIQHSVSVDPRGWVHKV